MPEPHEQRRHRYGDQPEVRDDGLNVDAQKRIDLHVRNDAMRWKMLTWAVIAEFLIIAILSVGFLAILEKSNRNHDKIDSNQIANSTELMHTSYRLCSRINNDRALAHYYVAGGEPFMQKKMEKILPILDCSPNAVGLPAKPLSSAKQRDFVQRWFHDQLSPFERGICPNPPVASIC